MILFLDRVHLFLRMIKTYYFFSFFFLVIFSIPSKAQVFGGNPTALKFQQINTDTVRVIFPKSLELKAREIVWLTHELTKNTPAPLGGKFKKFNIVLQNQTTESNAYVAPAPWRSEFFMMPDLSNLSQTSLSWHQTLAIHEHRHLQQFANFKRGPQKLAGAILGQEGQVLLMGVAVPDWFWEGDAVWQETVATQQGRGRLPNFFNAYRSLWMANKNYTYSKLRNGSLRNFVPNHYDLGYLLVNYGREKYGEDFWQKVTTDALNYKGAFYPFQKAVKRYSSTNYKEFVNNSFSFYKKEMQIENLLAYANAEVLTKPTKNAFTQFQFPNVLDDGAILTLKSSYKNIPTWVLINAKGDEQKLRVKDIAGDSYYSFKNNTVVYTAFEPNARWGWKNYSVLKIWNIKTNEVQQVSVKSRLFMPDISADLKTVVAVHVGTDIKNELQLITLETKDSVSVPNNNNYVYTYPKFTADDKAVISAVRNSKGEMTLAETNLQTHEEQLLFPFVNTPIGFVQVLGDSILFSAAEKETDVLYLFNRKENSLYKIASLPNGNYQATIDKTTNSLLWNSFGADGVMLLKQPLLLQKIEKLEPLTDLYFTSKTTATYSNVLANVQQHNGELKKYKPSFNLINIHSWRPSISESEYGITFFGENVLNTFSSEYNYTYNVNEGFHRTGISILYGGLFPVLSSGASQTFNRSDFINADTTITWNQTNANFGVSIPLNLTKGRTFKSLSFSSSLNTEQLQYTGIAKNFIANESFNYISSTVSFLNQSQRARQHIYPRWAQSFRVQYRRTVNGKFGNQFLANTNLYFPGLLTNHNLQLSGSIFARDTSRGSKFINNLAFARGYNALNFPRAWRVSVNYHFPIAYPEFGIGNMIYFLRIRANTFFDYTKGRSLRTGNTFPFKTVGSEIYFDTKIWNWFEASFGFRYSRLLDIDRIDPGRNANQFEIVLPVDLF